MPDKSARNIEVIPSGLRSIARDTGPLQRTPPEDMMLPGVEYIGRGVDVIKGTFACATSIMEQLFNIKDRIYPGDKNFPTRANSYASCERLYGKGTYGLVEVEPTIGGEQSMYTWSGSLVSEIQKKVSGSASVEGSFHGFSGEVKGMADATSTRSATSYFIQLLGRYPKYVLRLKPRDTLWALLLPEVQEALSNWSVEKLHTHFFPTYGGYYLHNAVLGGSVKYWAVRKKTSEQDESTFETTMKASYKYGIGEASGAAHVKDETQDKTFQENSENSLSARGGTTFPGYGTTGAVNKWIETILDAPELIDFDQGNGDGLRPVWSLIQDLTRANQVKDAFHVYAKAHGDDFDTFDPEIVPLNGFADWKSHDLRRWFYSIDEDHVRPDEWTLRHKHLGVYKAKRPGLTKFLSVRTSYDRGFLSGKHDIYKIVKDTVPPGYELVSTFYAPTAPLKGSLDKWQPVYEFNRNNKGDQCGKHYNTDKDVGAWKHGKSPLFYAAIR